MFSLGVAVLAPVPWLIKQNLGQFTIVTVLVFTRTLLSWFVHHFFFRLNFERITRAKWLQPAASITTATIIIFLLNHFFRNDTVMLGYPEYAFTASQALLINLFRSAAISGFCYFVVYYNQMNMQLQNSRLENEYLKQDQLKAQLFSLQQQLSPHFLFNSLSTLRTIAPDAETRTYVMQLANVYRYLLTFHEHTSVTLQSELAFMRSYLYILQERFENALKVTIDIDESLMNLRLPPLSLQILVENAIRHNVISTDQPLHLDITSEKPDTLVVTNSYQPKLSVEAGTGKGLQNIRDRYKFLAGKSISITQQHEQFIVQLPLLQS